MRSHKFLFVSLILAVHAMSVAGAAAERDRPHVLFIAVDDLPRNPRQADIANPPPPAEIERLRLDPFYRKYLNVGGFPIVASAKVSDYALLEAAHIVASMLKRRPDILRAIGEQGIRLAIMSPHERTTDIPEHSDLRPSLYWDRRARGLGSSRERPAVSCGEENLLCYPGDPYAAENILVHEFAHTIHLQGLAAVDPAFNRRLQETYQSALADGKWKGTYAAQNKEEYWAEGVQSWFDTNRSNDHEHNDIDTRDELKPYDPRLAALLTEVFGENDWRYVRPGERKSAPHLDGFDRSRCPRFAWSPEQQKAYDDFLSGTGDRKLDPLDEERAKDAVSAASSKPTSISFVNKGQAHYRIDWIDFEGRRQSRGLLPPGGHKMLDTYVGHLWRVTDERDDKAAVFAAAAHDGVVRLPWEDPQSNE